jgi:uncharacterized protein YceK
MKITCTQSKALTVAVLLAIGSFTTGCATSVARVSHVLTNQMGGHSGKLPPYPGLVLGVPGAVKNPEWIPCVIVDLPFSAAADTVLLPYDLYQLTK